MHLSPRVYLKVQSDSGSKFIHDVSKLASRIGYDLYLTLGSKVPGPEISQESIGHLVAYARRKGSYDFFSFQ
eukprot:1374232-Amorphochlora_amoeboformis.AAC.1